MAHKITKGKLKGQYIIEGKKNEKGEIVVPDLPEVPIRGEKKKIRKVNSKKDAAKKETTPKKTTASNISWKGGTDKNRQRRITKWKKTQERYEKGRESKGPRSYSEINSSISKDMKKTPAAYSPYKMKAKDYGNSPMKKNYGAFGTKHPEGPEKVGPNTPLNKNKTMHDVVAEKHKDDSPAKFGGIARMLGGAGSLFKRHRDKVKNMMGMAKGKVPKHGDESHTDGGAVGGGEEQGFQAMGRDEFMGMDKAGKVEYMKGLSEEDRKTQIRSMADEAMERHRPTMFGKMLSDIRVKENIVKTGVSKSGIPTYEFNYIGDNNRYSGAMAQDLLNTDAVSIHESGYYMVDYSKIDVDMHLINN